MAFTVGDGTNTTYNFGHFMNTRNLLVQVRENGGNYDLVDCDITLPTPDQIALSFTTPPGVDAYQVFIIA